MKEQTAPEVIGDIAPQKVEKRPASFYMALVAIIISLVGTCVSIVEARILRDQQNLMVEEKAASVWPYITDNSFVRQDSTTLTVEFSVRNDGVGPALISKIDLLLDEKPISLAVLVDSISNQYPEMTIVPTLSVDWERKVLAAGETTSFLRLICIGPQVDIFVGNDILKRLSRQYCYCSIYGDCWEANHGEPELTDNCGSGFEIK